MAWQGVVKITVTLETEYEFGDDGLLSAETTEQAKDTALRMVHEDVLQMAYRSPSDLWAWVKQSAQYELRAWEER